jgi:hypothetical protein
VTSIDFNTGNITTAPGVTTFDPTVPDGCLTPPNNIPTKLFKESPILKRTSFNSQGTDLGYTQYIDAFQRANFWQVLVDNRITNQYHVMLNPAKVLAPIIIDVPVDKGFAAIDPLVFGPPPLCEAYANVDFTWFNNYLTNTLLPELTAQG